jgi:hypothetical protein
MCVVKKTYKLTCVISIGDLSTYWPVMGAYRPKAYQ